MKKLLMSLALVGTFAAMSAKGDSYLYWMVDASTDPSVGEFDAAELYAFYDGGKHEFLGASAAADGKTDRNLATGEGSLSGYNIASISGYPEISFLVELYNGDKWVSQSILSYTDAKAGIYEHLAPGGAGAATFTTFAVPEPTSGLLMLFGLCGLALKRKRV